MRRLRMRRRVRKHPVQWLLLVASLLVFAILAGVVRGLRVDQVSPGVPDVAAPAE